MATKPKMSKEHKSALAKGRRQGATVSAYLDVLQRSKPKRGRKRTPESINNKLSAIEAELPEATGTRRLDLLQERRDLQKAQQVADDTAELERLQGEFVEIAKDYSDRKGIEYATWREAGVPAAVLKDAGVSRAAR